VIQMMDTFTKMGAKSKEKYSEMKWKIKKVFWNKQNININ
jgi:hypothetical protein